MIKELIYKHFEEQEAAPRELKSFAVSPSGFFDCVRKTYYRYAGEAQSNPVEEHARLKMALGTAAHEMVQAILKKRGVWREGEDLKTNTLCGLPFRYRIDGHLVINGEQWLVEIKSIYASGWNAVEKQPKPEHVMQLVLYMELEGVKNGSLFYIGRDNGFCVEYILKSGDRNYVDAQRQVLARAPKLQQLKTQIEKGELPEREFQICLKKTAEGLSWSFQKDKVRFSTDWQCSYCQWRDKCHKEEIDKFKASDATYLIGKTMIS